MNYHLPVNQNEGVCPLFAIINNEIIAPQKVYSKDQYPSLPHSMVKIAARDGRNIFVPMHKVSSMDA